MIFSTAYWLTSILWALFAAGFAAFLTYQGGSYKLETSKKDVEVDAKSAAIFSGLIAFVVGLFLVRITLYYGQPVFQGSLFGYWTLIFWVLVPAAGIGMLINGYKSALSWLATLGLLVAVFVVPTVQYGYNAWGTANATLHAELPNIRIAGADEKIPPTDPDRMVLVSPSIAKFKGQTALSTESGIASRFTINQDTYTLQFVNGHRYWIAPLTLINTGDTFWTPLFGGIATSPGYVVVDAENPDKEAWLKTDFQISLFEDQDWSLNLERWVYQQGWTQGVLDEPIFEVDDEWRPFYTIGYVRKAFGDMTGNRVEKVLAIGFNKSVPELTAYEIKDKPSWIDRINSRPLVEEWATDWGWYGGEYARNNHWSVVFDNNRTGTMKPTDYELAYTKDGHNVWVVPMSSTHENDHTVIGILVFETGENKATFYPGIKGFNEPSSVDETMVQARDNIKKYPVESVQLVYIYGELTWVAIYASDQGIGKSFGGIGIVHAYSQDAADVVFDTDRNTVLQKYASQLAKKGTTNASISQTSRQSKEITGRIKRISELPTSGLGGAPTYLFVIAGDKRTYVITRDTYRRIPLVREGDTVSFTFLDTNSSENAVNSFRCKFLDEDESFVAPTQPESK